MREICQSGSGEGAVQPRPYLIPNARLSARFSEMPSERCSSVLSQK